MRVTPEKIISIFYYNRECGRTQWGEMLSIAIFDKNNEVLLLIVADNNLHCNGFL